MPRIDLAAAIKRIEFSEEVWAWLDLLGDVVVDTQNEALDHETDILDTPYKRLLLRSVNRDLATLKTVYALLRFEFIHQAAAHVRLLCEALITISHISRNPTVRVASISITDGPPMLKSENARPSGWVYVDVRGRDLASVANELRDAVSRQIKLEPGVSITYSGQFEYLERANARLKVVVPATLLIIFVLLYLTFSRMGEAGLIMATLPFALTGGIWFLYLMNYNLSIATGVGFIALAGGAAEFGVVMLIYLKQALAERCPDGRQPTLEELLDAIREGAVLRVRPKAMTVAVILGGLVPVVWSSGTGSEVMSRIAALMLGGMVTAPLLSLFVIPAAYVLMRKPRKRDLLDTEAS